MSILTCEKACDSSLDSDSILPALWADMFPPCLLQELHEHPFLRACRTGESDLGILCDFLIQHQYYSQYFTRYLCAMMASLPNNGDVRALAENLFEEMGFEDPGLVTHAELYLRSMAVAGAKPQSKPMLGATSDMVNAMFRYCRSPDPLDGLAALCLGAEAIVPVVYGGVLAGLRQAGVPAKGLEFFELHVAEDENHAILMREIIDKLLADHPHRRAKVRAIGEDMVRLRMAMFNAITEQYRKAA